MRAAHLFSAAALLLHRCFRLPTATVYTRRKAVAVGPLVQHRCKRKNYTHALRGWLRLAKPCRPLRRSQPHTPLTRLSGATPPGPQDQQKIK